MKKICIVGAGSLDTNNSLNEIVELLFERDYEISRYEPQNTAYMKQPASKATQHLQNKGTRRSSQRRSSKPWNRR